MQGDVYEFEGFRLDAGRRVLTDATGKPVQLAPRVFDTLLHLVEHAGELVEKSALLEAVWPDVTVEENSLTQNISTLRRVFADTPGDNRFIVTAPGRGYRFVAAVAAATPKTAVQGKASAGGKIRASIAVMPFANLTGDPAKEYFSDGMADEIITLLTRVSNLKVPSRMSTFAYKGRNIDVRKIAEDLGVDAVLEGSVRAAGDRVRISAQIVDGTSGYQLWSQVFDRGMSDVFALQDEISVAVIEALRRHLNAQPLVAHGRKPPTKNLEAYRLLLLADWMATTQTEQSLLAARELYLHALALDPEFGRAYAQLAAMAMIQSMQTGQQARLRGEINEFAHKALAIDPDLEIAHVALGYLNSLKGDLVAAEQCFRAAMQLSDSPGPYTWHLSMVLSHAGHLQRGLDCARAAYRFAPFMPFVAVAMALAASFAGETEEVRHYADAALGMGQFETVQPLSEIVALLRLKTGDWEIAPKSIIASATPMMALPGASEAVKLAYRAMGGAAPREDALSALRDLYPGGPPPDGVDVKRLILWHAMLGDLNGAYGIANAVLDALEKEGVAGAAWGVLWLPEMGAFRDDPRFMRIARRTGMSAYWKEYGPPDGYEIRNGRLFRI